jgi:hypothetical protein
VLTVTTVALLGYAPAAPASSLLSGYGGPGQGSQTILGAALIGGPSGSGGGGAGGGSTAAAGGGAVALGVSGAGGASATGAPGSRSRSGSGGGASGSHAGSAAPAAPLHRVAGPATALSAASVRSNTLGVSGADLVYILLGLGGLLAAGVFTRHLVRSPR